MSKVVADYPNICAVIEKFVQECSDGANAWQRTGVLNVDGNEKLKKLRLKKEYERTVLSNNFVSSQQA